MILAKISEKKEYYGIHPQLDKVLDLLTEEFLQSVPTEKTLLDGEDLFVTRFFVKTAPFEETFYESHKQYLDIQAVTEGEERMDVAHPDHLTLNRHEGDFYGYADGKADQSVILRPGSFVVLFPGDAHRLRIPVGQSGENVTRVVFKAKIYD